MEMAKKKKGISGSTLKMIAIITMLIDHIGAGVVGRYLSASGIEQFETSQGVEWIPGHMPLLLVYGILRMVGRVAFPIFCFLLIEGFVHTHDVKKYAARLLIFALVSEVPYDLLFQGQLLEFGNQNVFFTLLIGLLVIWAVYWIWGKSGWNPPGKFFSSLLVVAAGMWVADFLKTDYGSVGVVCILILYLFRRNKINQIIAGCAVFMFEITAPVAFVPIAFYNGERGSGMKYFFYIFYPAHLLLLYLLCVLLGISSFGAL